MQTTDFHFILTLQDGHGRMATSDGLVPLIPGQHTRTQALAALKDQMVEHYGFAQGVTVVFFSLAPDAL